MSQPGARREHLTPEAARWLVSERGRHAAASARAALEGGSDTLAIVTGLRADGLDTVRASAALSAAEADLRMPTGLSSLADDPGLVFTRSALEQASDPVVAAWRAARLAGRIVADLGCGAGADLLAIARHAARVVGVERHAARATLARHNVAATGVDAHVVVGDALRAPVRVDAVHADPSRRVDGRRARRLADYGPPVGVLLDAVRTADVGVVVSPAVDWADPQLPDTAEVEFVQRGRELVEAALWLGTLRRPGARATATILDDGGVAVTMSRSVGDEREPLPVGPVGPVLLEVEPAAVRARLHEELGVGVGARRVARNRALLTADTAPSSSPWYRVWQVESQLPTRAKAIRRWLREADERPLEIATSGFDADPEHWWRELGRPPRGPQGRRLLLVRLDEGSVALVLRPSPTDAAVTS